jgi:uncharacterized protein (DUF433 family)
MAPISLAAYKVNTIIPGHGSQFSQITRASFLTHYHALNILAISNILEYSNSKSDAHY